MSLSAAPSRARWGSWMVRRHYRRDGWSDAGEQAAIESLKAELDGGRVLDVGVGGGRTTSFLAPSSASYIGVDNSREMVRMARRRHPGVDIRWGDARELDGIADSSCDVVVFSSNGIDAVPPADRERVLATAHRVLVPGGHLLVSMLNLNEAEPPARPTIRALFQPPRRPGWRRLVVPVKHVFEGLVSFYHHRRTEPCSHEHDGWAWRPLREHEFRFLVQFTRFDVAVASLRDAGFDVLRAWSSIGEPLDVDAARQVVGYTHFVARRPA